MIRLQHDTAWRTASRLMRVVGPLVPEQNPADCFRQLLAIVQEELARYEAKRQHMDQRLHPESR